MLSDFLLDDSHIPENYELNVQRRIVEFGLLEFLQSLLFVLHFFPQEKSVGNSEHGVEWELFNSLHVHFVDELEKQRVFLIHGLLVGRNNGLGDPVVGNLFLQRTILLVAGLVVHLNVPVEHDRRVPVVGLHRNEFEQVSDLSHHVLS